MLEEMSARNPWGIQNRTDVQISENLSFDISRIFPSRYEL